MRTFACEFNDRRSWRLQPQRNLEADPRATLLVEHWDPADWSRLWWVRAELRWQSHTGAGRAAALAAQLAGRYPQYRNQPFARVLVRRIVGVAAGPPAPADWPVNLYRRRDVTDEVLFHSRYLMPAGAVAPPG